MGYNFNTQYYKKTPIRLIDREDYDYRRAKQFALVKDPSKSVWMPNKHLMEDGTLVQDEKIDYVFRSLR